MSDLASDTEYVCNINQPILQKGRVQCPHPHTTGKPQPQCLDCCWTLFKMPLLVGKFYIVKSVSLTIHPHATFSHLVVGLQQTTVSIIG